jgi:tRNA/rRNA methyltransferase
MKSFYVYMLKCGDDSYYIGHTDCLEMRMAEHYMGKISGYTKSRLPVKLVFFQEFGSRYEALAAERQIKGWSRKKKEALINQEWDKIIIASRKKTC